MNTFLTNMTLVAMLGVLVVLSLGIFSLVKGGAFRERWSNKLMRLRVLLQAVAIILLCVLLWWRTSHGG